MLKRFRVQRFKSLADVEVELPRMLVLFGPNAAGKSNFLEALQCLSRLVTERTIKDALADPMRGYPHEAFEIPLEGLKGLLDREQVSFEVEADILPEARGGQGERPRTLRYRAEIAIQPRSGALSVRDEYLAELQRRKNKPHGNPVIEREGSSLRVRARGQGGHPFHETVGQNHTTASVPSLAGNRYHPIETLRRELSAWRTYYLDPRGAMRSARPPTEVTDIGPLGETIAPYLYRLKMEHCTSFQAVRRALSTVIPSVEDLDVSLNRERGELEIAVVQDGIHFPTRIISEGTLRVLALCALCVNPWRPALIAFEEPENGVHPRRLDLIAQLLVSLATEDGTQVVVTTHSPRFCDAVLRQREEVEAEIGLWATTRKGRATRLRPFDPAGPLFQQREISDALTSPTEDGVFEALMSRGLIDG